MPRVITNSFGKRMLADVPPEPRRYRIVGTVAERGGNAVRFVGETDWRRVSKYAGQPVELPAVGEKRTFITDASGKWIYEVRTIRPGEDRMEYR